MCCIDDNEESELGDFVGILVVLSNDLRTSGGEETTERNWVESYIQNYV